MATSRTYEPRGLGEFIATIREKSIARSAHFFIEMGVPNFMKMDMDDMRMVNLYCSDAILPEMVLNTAPVHEDGLERQIVVNKSYGRIPMVFVCDSDMVVKSFFDNWVQGVVVSKGGRFAYPSEYTVESIDINQLNVARETVYTVSIYDAYPVSVRDMALNSASHDYHRVQVEFVYRHWISGGAKEHQSSVPDDISKFLRTQSNTNIPGIPQLLSLNSNMRNRQGIFSRTLEVASNITGSDLVNGSVATVKAISPIGVGGTLADVIKNF